MKVVYTKKENEILEKEYEDLKLKYEEMKIFFDSFKELCLYSETDLEGVITDISESFCNLIGYKKEEIIGKKHSILKHPLESELKYEDLWKNLLSGNNWIGELLCKDKFENDIWYKTIIFPKKNKSGEIIGYAAKRENINDKKDIEILSITDDLTGLYNRKFFNQILENQRNNLLQNKKNLITLMIDIDYFKKINDTYGHLKGDEVLKQISEVLKQNTRRTNEFAFRLGGDEFAIITSELSLNDVLKYAENIKNSISNLKILNENSVYKYLTVSIGIFILGKKKQLTNEEIYDFTDKALYRAKKLRNHIVFYE